MKNDLLVRSQVAFAIFVHAVFALGLLGQAAFAQTSYRQTGYGVGPAQPYDTPFGRGPSTDQWYQKEYHESGTLGRMGLGADPRHPEGPGNATSPGR